MAALLAVACLTGFAARPVEQPRGLFTGLDIGQAVSVEDLGSVYEITVFDEGLPTGHEITEVGEDHLTVRDHVGVTERRIPTTSIKSIVRMRLGGR